MTSAAIAEFDQFFMILASNLNMAIQTPTPIHYLGVFGDGHLGHIALSVLTVLSRGHMGAMIKLNKVRHLRYRDPLKGLAA